jgi:hypothetical protein
MQDAYMHICSHLDTISAIRFAATSKSIRTAVKESVDSCTTLLNKRVVMPMVHNLQEHLISEYHLHTVLAFHVSERECFHVYLKSDANEHVVRIHFTLYDPSVSMSMHLPWRKHYTPGSETYQSFIIYPTTEMAGVVDYAPYENGLSVALLEREIIWSPTFSSQLYDMYDDDIYSHDTNYEDMYDDNI